MEPQVPQEGTIKMLNSTLF